jgi:trans-aconitate 2-methyltransferase
MSADSSDAPAAYQFGDTDLAAERLLRLADVFNPSSREFLATLADRMPRDILDLGCGPGHTTRMLADVFPQANVVGLDSSPHFVELARRAAVPRVTFTVRDVTQPLPGGPYDLAYCRYLLTHLPGVEEAINRWSGHLRGGGLLVVEENEWIRTGQPAFAKYLEIVAGMLAAKRQMLYVGAQLARIERWERADVRSSVVAPVTATAPAAAAMFLPNLATWREQPFIRQHHSSGELDRLHGDLQQLAASPMEQAAITFGLRRLVLERRAS